MTNARSVAISGLAGTVVVAMTMAAIACASIRALAESEHARVELRIANERLQQQNTELQTRELAVEEGLEWIDERTQGCLRDLVEEAGDQLAALVDAVLDAPPESCHDS